MEKINIILEPYPWIDNGNLYETEWNPNNKNSFLKIGKIMCLKY